MDCGARLQHFLCSHVDIDRTNIGVPPPRDFQATTFPSSLHPEGGAERAHFFPLPFLWERGKTSKPPASPRRDFARVVSNSPRFLLPIPPRRKCGAFRSAIDVVFQTLVHTVGTGKADLQVFLRTHNERNPVEYEGRVEMDERLLADLIRWRRYRRLRSRNWRYRKAISRVRWPKA